MHKLNLPPAEFNVKKAGGKVWIFDVIRKKFVVLTPEEWVRQNFVHYLISELHYPKSLVKIEGGLSFNSRQKRSDIVVFDRVGKPWMLVECKSPVITITSQTALQASVYNATLQAPYLTLTNGLVHFCTHINWETGTTHLLDMLPAYK